MRVSGRRGALSAFRGRVIDLLHAGCSEITEETGEVIFVRNDELGPDALVAHHQRDFVPKFIDSIHVSSKEF